MVIMKRLEGGRKKYVAWEEEQKTKALFKTKSRKEKLCLKQSK